MSLSSSWSTEWIPRHLGLHREILCQKLKKKCFFKKRLKSTVNSYCLLDCKGRVARGRMVQPWAGDSGQRRGYASHTCNRQRLRDADLQSLSECIDYGSLKSALTSMLTTVRKAREEHGKRRACLTPGLYLSRIFEEIDKQEKQNGELGLSVTFICYI